MNSRIDSLIEQCTIQQFSDCVGGYETFDRERFAELIVAECVAIAQSADDDSWKLDGKGTEIARNIQQHFGVEE